VIVTRGSASTSSSTVLSFPGGVVVEITTGGESAFRISVKAATLSNLDDEKWLSKESENELSGGGSSVLLVTRRYVFESP
jgi:hypothetical protein